MSSTRGFILLFFLACFACFAGNSNRYGNLPLVFEPNQGQVDAGVKFLARGQRYVVGLGDSGLQLQLRGTANPAIQIQFIRKRRNSQFDAPDALPGVSNYLIGNDPRLWIKGIPQFGKVWQRGVYPGIDVAYYGTQGQLEYDFVLQPGADPAKVRMHISGVSQLGIDAGGDLLFSVNGVQLRQKLPIAWQGRGGKRIAVRVRYRLLAHHTVGLSVANYDHTQMLVIDPVLALSYSTYLGGSLADKASGIAVDSSGNAWIAGLATSLNFPVTGSPTPVNAGGTDAFVAKLDPTGTTLMFATYLGGSGTDQANGIAVDVQGNAYVTGSTDSTNFPVLGALQPFNAGAMDAFAVKLNANGSLVFSTYVGGAGDDIATGVAVDSNANAYMTGYTASTNFPTASPQQGQNRGGTDAFVFKLNATGSALTYSTYYGGMADDRANAIAIDSLGNAYIAGATSSTDFPAAGAFQAAAAGGGDAFVSKFNPSGTMVYSTYLGGSGVDAANAVAVDTLGDAYVAGSTTSSHDFFHPSGVGFPVKNAFQSQWSDSILGFGSEDAFLTKLNPVGNDLVFSTYFGGATTGLTSIQNTRPGGPDVANGLAVDATGNVYMTGYTTTPSFPKLDPVQGYNGPANGGPSGVYYADAFLASFNPTGSLLYSTALGGLLDDFGTAVAVDSSGAAYLAGYSNATDFPVQNPFQSAKAGTANAFISKLTFSTPGVRVFFGVAALGASYSDANYNASVPITISGVGCSPGNYMAVSTLRGSGTSVVFQPGATCTVSVAATSTSPGTRYAFSSWGDGSTANPRVITAPAKGTEYSINLATQFQLTTTVAPPGSGTIVLSPSSPDGYYAADTNVMVTAVPAQGFAFNNFVGLAGGNGVSVLMLAPYNITAYFVPSAPPTVFIDTPRAGDAVSGMVDVTGWAIDNATAIGTPISSVFVKVDGVSLGRATYGVFRGDVCAVYPGRANCPNVGFSFSLNTNTLGPGQSHTITVTATDSDASPDSGTASVVVTSALAMAGTRVGAFRNGRSFLEDSNGNGLFDQGVDQFISSFTPPGGALPADVPVTGDWNGDGHTKVGIYRPSTGTWWLDVNNDGVFDAGDSSFQFGGLTGDIPFAGDWNFVQGVSTHKDCIGVYRTQGSFWILDLNCNGTLDAPDSFFPFGGIEGDVPVVGKWTGGKTRVGVVRKYAPAGIPQGEPYFWVFDNSDPDAGGSPLSHPPAAGAFAFGGLPGDIFVTGDWNNTGISRAGVFRSGNIGVQPYQWVLDANGFHTPDVVFNLFGLPGDKPVTGKW